jgi:hypothetical protein
LDWLWPQSVASTFTPSRTSNADPSQVAVHLKPLAECKETAKTVVDKKRGLEPEAKQQGPLGTPSKKHKFGNDALGKIVSESIALFYGISIMGAIRGFHLRAKSHHPQH